MHYRLLICFACLGLMMTQCFALKAQDFQETYAQVVQEARQQNYQKALQLAEGILPQAAKILGEKSINLSNFLNTMAGFYEQTAQPLKALPFYQKVAQIRSQVLAPTDAAYLKTLNKLANLYFLLEKYTEASQSYQRILAIHQPPDTHLPHLVLFNTYSNLGFLYFYQRQWHVADSLYTKAQGYLNTLQTQDTLSLLIHLERKAQLYEASQRKAEAILAYQDILKLQKKFYGVMHPYYLPNIYQKARLHRQQGQYSEAIQTLDQIPLMAWQTLTASNTLYYELSLEGAENHLLLQETFKADSILNQIHPEKKSPKVEPRLLGKYYHLKGKLGIQQNKAEEAASFFEKSWQVYTEEVQRDSTQVLALLYDWGAWLDAQKEHQEAEKIWERALSYHSPQDTAQSAMLETQYNLAIAQQKNQQLGKARANYETLLNQSQITAKLKWLIYIQLARLAQTEGKPREALQHYQEARSITKQPSAHNAAIYYQAIQEASNIHQEFTEYALAQNILKEALDYAPIQEKIKLHTQLALLAYLNAQYQEAQAQYQQILAYAQRKELPFAVLISTLNNLGNLYKNQGFLIEAERVLLQAQKACAENKTSSPALRALTAHNLASLSQSLGRYEEAAHLLEKAWAMSQESNLAETIQLRQEILLSKATLLRQKGEFAQAERLYRESLAILETQNAQDQHYQKIMKQLAQLYLQTGRYTAAVSLLEQLTESSENILLSDFGGALARAYQKTNQTEKAEKLLLKIIRVRKQHWGAQHPDIATAQDQLGHLYRQRGAYTEAKNIFEEAKTLRQKVLGLTHPAIAISQHNLAMMAEYQQDKALAEKLYKQSVELIQNQLGDAHPYYMQALANLASFYEKNKAPKKALIHYQEALDRLTTFIQKNITVLSEQEQRQFWQINQTLIQNFLSFSAQSVASASDFDGLDLAEIWGETINLRLNTKGLLLIQTRKAQQDFGQTNDPKTQELYTQWLSNREWLAHYASQTKSESILPKIDSLRQANEDLEKALLLRTSIQSEQVVGIKHTWQHIQSQLKAGEAAIEMIQLPIQVKNRAYLAMILLPAPAEPIPVLLSEGNRMEGAYWAYYRNNILFQQKDTQSYGRYWESIQQVLNQHHIHKIYFSPDGVYYLLNIASFYNLEQGQYLDESLSIVRLSSLKDLANFEETILEKAEASLWGRPLYSLGENINQAVEDYKDLSNTEAEVAQIAAMMTQKGWTVKSSIGKEAREKNIKEEVRQHILHLATHGYFELEKKELLKENLSEGLVLTESAWLNPLINSGLVWAGVNTPDLLSEGEDGKLTALEVSQLSLSNTKLVVLSACQTGLGKIESGQGVYGLQRAFQVAGVKSLLMSLWEVNDQATQEFMLVFYEYLLQGQAPRVALKEARAEIREKYKHPYYWAAFVLLEQ